MSGGSDSVNFYVAIALIIGIIGLLAISFYYEFETSTSSAKASIPVVTVTATKIVYVNASTPTCAGNETSIGNSTTTC